MLKKLIQFGNYYYQINLYQFQKLFFVTKSVDSSKNKLNLLKPVLTEYNKSN